METMSDPQDAANLGSVLAEQLGDCRQRGLDDLDLDTHNQRPVHAPDLERLARQYTAAKGLDLHGRIAQIRRLLHDALAVYAERGNEIESQFIASLFFDPSSDERKKRPGELLAEAQKASGLKSRTSFDERRAHAFQQFAVFLLGFAAETAEAATPRAAPSMIAGRRRWLVIGGVVVLLAAGGVSVWQFTISTAKHGTASGTPPPVSTHTSTSVAKLTGTHTEQAGQYGAPTFTNPYRPGPTGVTVQPYQRIRVSCKVKAPTIPSFTPDGYVYRIASSPWNNRSYAAANAFLNGDSPDSTKRKATHNTDFAVPDCT